VEDAIEQDVVPIISGDELSRSVPEPPGGVRCDDPLARCAHDSRTS
jgi:hypothetical protein